PSAVPPAHPTHRVLGAVTAEAAALTGLPTGLPVYGGAADHIASALAAGITRPGDVLLKFGGAGDIIVASATAKSDPRLYLDYHLVPGLYAPNGCMAATGSALNWLAKLLAPEAGEAAHAQLDALAAEVPAGADGLVCLPYFLGEKTPIHDPFASGTFTGLSLSHTRGHLWRALLEAVALAFRHHVAVLDDIGHAPQRFFASDGGTRSRVWMGIMADVLQRPVQLLANPLGSAVGAAWVAAIGGGDDLGWDDVTALVRTGEKITPDPAKAEVYDRLYRDFSALYATLHPFFHRSRP
ncbi:carbohydrate kinase, partial [Rhodospirillum rubrum]|nr:carbohydrate kinase [Rhodospirillum rubrum]